METKGKKGIRVYRLERVAHVGIDNYTPDQSEKGWSSLAHQVLDYLAAGVSGFQPDVPFLSVDYSRSSVVRLEAVQEELELEEAGS